MNDVATEGGLWNWIERRNGLFQTTAFRCGDNGAVIVVVAVSLLI